MANRRRKRKKSPIKFVVILVLSLMLLFAVTFVIFFRLLGGSFTNSRVETTDIPMPTPTITAAAETASPEETAAPVNETSDEKHWTAKETQKPTASPTKAPTERPVIEEKGDPVELRGGEYKYPTNKKVITEAELSRMSRSDIKIIFNEIYARHGLTFNDDELVDYFEMQPWYIPTTSSSKTAENEFSAVERENYNIIYNYQKKMGWR